jgi:hypothetical protein
MGVRVYVILVMIVMAPADQCTIVGNGGRMVISTREESRICLAVVVLMMLLHYYYTKYNFFPGKSGSPASKMNDPSVPGAAIRLNWTDTNETEVSTRELTEQVQVSQHC